MPDYRNAIIYTITSPHTDQVYVGSTTIKPRQRLAQHRYDFKSGRGLSSAKLFELGEVDLVVVSKIECQTKEELLRKERLAYELFDCVNKNVPNRSQKEYMKTPEGKAYAKAQREKAPYIAYAKAYSSIKVECACGKTYSRRNRTHHERTMFHQQSSLVKNYSQ